MEVRSPYDILGVPRDADQEAIKRAYRRIVLKSHPDKNPGDVVAERTFREATAAYDTLNDPKKKEIYDFNSTLGDRTPRSPFNRARTSGGDVFEDIFGAAWPQSRPGQERRAWNWGDLGQDHGEETNNLPGEDTEAELALTLEEAASGCVKEIVSRSKTKTTCQACGGSRCESGTGKTPCASCSGSGQTLDFKNGLRKCPACAGLRTFPISPCLTCGGNGRVRTERKVKIRLPVGVDTGQRLRLAGMGASGNGGPPGDLFITVNVAPHDVFTRRGADIHREFHVPLTLALRGGIISVPTIDGPPASAEVQPNSNPGKTVIVIKKAGIRSVLTSERGDMYVTVQVQLPRVVTPRAHKLIEELTEELERTNPK